MRLEINYKKKTEKHTNTWRLKNLLLNNQQITKGIKEKIKNKTKQNKTLRWQRNMLQMKEQEKSPEEQLNDVEIASLPEKKFRVMIVKMTQELGKTMQEQSKK